MAPTILTGARATQATKGITAARIVINMAKRILLLEPSSMDLTKLLMRLDKESVDNFEFKVTKDELLPTVTAINSASGYTATDVTLKVDHEEYADVGGLALIPRLDEVVYISAKSATDSTWVVTRDFAGESVNAALVDNEPIMILSDANAENADSKDSITTKVTTATNLTQIFRTSFDVSGTLQAINLYGGPDFPYQAKKKGIEHLRKLNLAMWFGQKKSLTTGNYPIRATGGIDQWIDTNETDAGGNLTSLELVNLIRDPFRYGESKSRAMFMSREVADAISLIGLNRVEVSPETKALGMALERWFSPHGAVFFVVENLFSEIDHVRERAYLLDMSQLGYRYLPGRDTHIRTNIQAPGVDGRKDEYLTEAGLQRGIEKSSARLKGVTLG